ncbi:MAG: T9SS type A sorting domain-containing protein, partial [Ignavibacteria bacterium]
STSIVGVNNESFQPTFHYLYQNYPNPFNPTTMISYQLANQEYVILKIFDILGNEIETLVNEYKNAGVHEIGFDASNLSSGIYLAKIDAGSFHESKKMLLLK